ncbi:DDE-type integrase/transposase/recombinase [Streptomyces sp. ISL-66]|uniref:DDE-type integrase/transposase/recombinase n=1 Tax=Streptomyces sp. ISL-66 TaxID=2819186 RepID=UPI001BE81DF0|nr:DDE-type integrase/transposase/recombinase [Streptomyces sp. ISL-66]MBT2472582.1 DDE-type integrase/transposase/recombinase [Streptomyces sp. ISL-66]
MSSSGARRPVVAVGGHVVFEGRTWQVAAMDGSVVRLIAEDGTVTSLLTGYLCAAADFAVVGARPAVGVPQWGLFETVPVREQERALAWQRHLQEIECGLPGGPGSAGVPRPAYALERPISERVEAKAAELASLGWVGVSAPTIRRMRARYRRQGLWGLVDHRTTKPSSRTGRADEQVVMAVLEALRRQRGRSKSTLAGLRELTRQVLAEAHGPEAGRLLPPVSTFNRLVRALADPRELPGRPARTASSPAPPFTPTMALRPGEQVMLDTTRLDIMAVSDHGVASRPELTIALDVATRSILAAVLRPGGTKAVDAALLLAEMAVPHPVRPHWPACLHLAHASIPYERLLDIDTRLEHAAARPVIIPETVIVDRGNIYLSAAFRAACETLGVSLQPAPPRQPAAKGPVERTFASINTLFCQYVAGYTGSNVVQRGRDAEKEACWSVAQLQELLEEWITAGWQPRPHEGLRHPTMAKAALSPNEMWAALIAAFGYMPVPLTGRDYIELLPTRWHKITDRGIRISHRTYDNAILNPLRGQPSDIHARSGKWEVHHNPHDARQVWIRLPDGHLAEIGWIHRDHVHQPFNDHLWQHLKTEVEHRGDSEQYESDLAGALQAILTRARAGTDTRTSASELAEAKRVQAGVPAWADTLAIAGGAAQVLGETSGPSVRLPGQATGDVPGLDGVESLDGLEETEEDDDQDWASAAEAGGFGLYDARREAEQW